MNHIASILVWLVREQKQSGHGAMPEWTADSGLKLVSTMSSLQRTLFWETAMNDVNKAQDIANKEQSNATNATPTTTTTTTNSPTTTTPPLALLSTASTDICSSLLSHIHVLVKGLFRLLAFSRHYDRTAQSLATTLCSTMIEHLNFINNTFVQKIAENNKAYVALYLTTIVGELKNLILVEGRSAVHSLFLYVFLKKEGISKLDKIFNTIRLQYIANQTKDQFTANYLEETMQTILTFLLVLSSPAAIQNSPVTENMLLMKNLPNQVGPFDPFQFINEVQSSVFNCIKALWIQVTDNSTDSTLFPTRIITSLLPVVEHVLQSADPKKNEAKDKKKKQKEEFVPDEVIVSQLCDMGFSRQHVERALREVILKTIHFARLIFLHF